MAKKAGAPPPPKTAGPRQYTRDKSGKFAKAEKPRATRKAQPAEDTEDQDSPGEALRTDLGPWAETPSSSRVSAYRYDYLKNETQVTWRNNGNPGYAYEGMNYEDFRRFARILSKGKYINQIDKVFSYRRLTPDEVNAPSNRSRRAVSRASA